MSEAQIPELFVSLPSAPCADCVTRNQQVIGDEFAVVWCPHTRFGGIYQISNATWHLSGPFREDDDFKRILVNFFRPRGGNAIKH